MDYVEVITDAATGEITIRPYTPEEISAIESEAAAVPASISFAQLLIGLVAEGWITEAEGDAWLTGTLPGPVVFIIGTLPADQQFRAKARAIRPSSINRDDPLVAMLAVAQGKTPEQIDEFFRVYSTV